MALADARGNKEGAQHAGADLVCHQSQVLVQRLTQTHYGVFGDVVNAHIGRIQQARHAGRIHNMALVLRVFLGLGQHHGRKHPHAVGHTHEVNAHHPLPVLECVFPNQTA